MRGGAKHSPFFLTGNPRRRRGNGLGTVRDLAHRVGEVKSGPDRYGRWVCQAQVNKVMRFWQKRSPNCDFLVPHSPSTLSASKNI
jgi:hypothetical protein